MKNILILFIIMIFFIYKMNTKDLNKKSNKDLNKESKKIKKVKFTPLKI
jgi:hypothetical protein